MDLASITPLILTLDEAPNIGRALERLTWARCILVVDSGSTDGTLEIVRGFRNVVVLHRAFTAFSDQCNFGLSHVVSDWVLSLDADYLVSPEFVAEIEALAPDRDVAGFSAGFRYCIEGKPLRAALYPPRTVLHRREGATYVSDGHAHRVRLGGSVLPLEQRLDHDDRKPLERWLRAQRSYAAREADKLMSLQRGAIGFADRLRLRGIAPFVTPLYCLLAKRLVLDGSAGWRYTLERTYAEILLGLELSERRARQPRTIQAC